MCHCYDHPCEVCGGPIPFHLGDFATDSLEILILHKRCIKKMDKISAPNRSRRIGVHPTYTEFTWPKDSGPWDGPKNRWERRIRVYYLTPNAIKNRYINHPNVGRWKIGTITGRIAKRYHHSAEDADKVHVK